MDIRILNLNTEALKDFSQDDLKKEISNSKTAVKEVQGK